MYPRRTPNQRPLPCRTAAHLRLLTRCTAWQRFWVPAENTSIRIRMHWLPQDRSLSIRYSVLQSWTTVQTRLSSPMLTMLLRQTRMPRTVPARHRNVMFRPTKTAFRTSLMTMFLRTTSPPRLLPLSCRTTLLTTLWIHRLVRLFRTQTTSICGSTRVSRTIPPVLPSPSAIRWRRHSQSLTL